MSRTLSALALTIVAITLIWGGHALNEAGREVTSQELSFAAEYYFGAQLLWMLAGALGAGIISLGSRHSADRSAIPLLAAAIVPISILLPTYIWFSTSSPEWLLEMTPQSEWLISPFVAASSSVLAGVLLGGGLLRAFKSPLTDQVEHGVPG